MNENQGNNTQYTIAYTFEIAIKNCKKIGEVLHLPKYWTKNCLTIKKECRIFLIWTVFVQATFFSIKEVMKKKIARRTSCQGQVLERMRVITHQHTSQVEENVEIRICQCTYTFIMCYYCQHFLLFLDQY